MRCFAEIDLGQLRENARILCAGLPKGCGVMAVVKANAYGHGAAAVAKELWSVGVTQFAVATLDEGIELRQAGVAGEILVLGYTPPRFVKEALQYDLTQTVLSEEHAEALIATGVRVKCQLAVDTGMHRLGVPADSDLVLRTALRCRERLSLLGVFTHLSSADEEGGEAEAFTKAQLEAFRAVCRLLSPLGLPYFHALNSAGGLYYGGIGNLVRFGIALYGISPNPKRALPDGVRPILSWKSRVLLTKTVKAGACIGYGREYVAPRDMEIAILGVGYADGYRRAWSCGYVMIGGRRAPVVGRVCMDLLTVDVTELLPVRVGDTATLLGEGVDAWCLAEQAESIPYEVLTGISPRVSRVYKGGDAFL